MASYAGRPSMTCDAHSVGGAEEGGSDVAANKPISNETHVTKTHTQINHQLLDALPIVSRNMNETNFSSTSTIVRNTFTVWYAYTNENNMEVEKRPEPLLCVVENAKYLAMYGVELRRGG